VQHTAVLTEFADFIKTDLHGPACPGARRHGIL